MSEEQRASLKSEFTAEDGSFLLKLRCEPVWDPQAFTRLVEAMKACCEETAGAGRLARWQAEGFWHVPQFVRTWSAHENFPRPLEPEYYERACQRLDDLAYWVFRGESPYQDGSGFEPL